MKIRKIAAFCTSLIMCASVLAGCGSEDEKSTEKNLKKLPVLLSVKKMTNYMDITIF